MKLICFLGDPEIILQKKNKKKIIILESNFLLFQDCIQSLQKSQQKKKYVKSKFSFYFKVLSTQFSFYLHP